MESRYFGVNCVNNSRCDIYIKSTGELASTVIFHRYSDDYSNEQYIVKLLKVMDSYAKNFEG